MIPPEILVLISEHFKFAMAARFLSCFGIVVDANHMPSVVCGANSEQLQMFVDKGVNYSVRSYFLKRRAPRPDIHLMHCFPRLLRLSTRYEIFGSDLTHLQIGSVKSLQNVLDQCAALQRLRVDWRYEELGDLTLRHVRLVHLNLNAMHAGNIVIEMKNLEHFTCFGPFSKVQVNSKKLKKLFTGCALSDWTFDCAQTIQCCVQSEKDVARLEQLNARDLHLTWSNARITRYHSFFEVITTLSSSPEIASALLPFLHRLRVLSICGEDNEKLALVKCKCVLDQLNLIDVDIDCSVLDSFAHTRSVFFESCNKEKTLDVSALSHTEKIKSRQSTGNLVGYQGLMNLRHLDVFSNNQKLECQNMRLKTLFTNNGASVLCSTLKKLRIFTFAPYSFDFAKCAQLEYVDISCSIDFESLLKNIGQLRTIRLKDDLTLHQKDELKRKGYRMAEKSGKVKFCRSI